MIFFLPSKNSCYHKRSSCYKKRFFQRLLFASTGRKSDLLPWVFQYCFQRFWTATSCTCCFYLMSINQKYPFGWGQHFFQNLHVQVSNKEICYDWLLPFQTKDLEMTEQFINFNRSVLHVFVRKPIHRNHLNTCDNIMKGTYAIHVMDYCITLLYETWIKRFYT